MQSLNKRYIIAYSRVDWALFTVRLFLGIILIAHGSQLLFGFFNGPGLDKTMSASGPGGGGVLGLLVAIGEFFGGLGILFGLLARIAAAANVLIMFGAILLVHSEKGFFSQQGGIEYPLALMGMCLVIVIAGPGLLSVGRLFSLVKPPTTKITDPSVLAE
jgi:putative oxidoreductase